MCLGTRAWRPMGPLETKRQLRIYICSELLGRVDYPLADNEPLITGGLIDSFSLAQISVFIESAFGIYVPDSDLTVANMNTLDLIVARILAENDD